MPTRLIRVGLLIKWYKNVHTEVRS